MKSRHLLTAVLLLLGSVLVSTSSLRAQTNVTYIGPANGSWITGSNWTGGVAPTNTAFNATVNVGSVVSVPSSVNNLTNFNLFGSTSGTGVIIVAGQTVIGDGASLGHGQLSANGGLTFQGSATSRTTIYNGNGTAPTTATWNSGTLSFTGSGMLNAANATWNAKVGLYDSVSGTNSFENQGTFNKNTDGTLFGGTLTIEPTFAQGSTGSLNVNAGELQLLGGGSSALQGVTNVLGTSTLTLGGSFTFNGGGPGSFSVAPTATLNIVSGTTIINTPYSHAATITVASGANLNLNTSGTHTGVFAPAAGGAVNFTAGTHTITTAATHTGAGSLNVSGGTVALDPGVALTGVGSLNVTGGTLSSSGTAEVSNPFGFTSGTVSVGGTLTLHTSATFSSAGLKRFIGGGTLNIGDGIGAAGSVTASWTGGTLDFNQNTIMNIKGDAAFTTNFDGTVIGQTTVRGTINVEAGGSFTKNGGTGTTGIGANGNLFTFNNNGTVNVQTGTLQIGLGAGSNGGTHSGAFNMSSGATLNLGGTHTLASGVTFNGAGSTLLSGTVTANVPVTFATTTTLSGTLTGTGTVDVTGPLTWSGGTMSGTGTTNILNSIGLTTSTTKSFRTGRIVNIGDGIGAAGSVTANWTGGTLDFNENSIMNIKADAAFTTDFDGTVIGQSATLRGTINVEAGGSLTKNGGTGTTGIGANSNLFTFNNNGTVNVSSGTLAIGNTLTQHSGSTLTGGTWNVTNGASINRTIGSDITTIGSGATVLLDGAGSSFSKVTTALATNQGSFTLKNNRDLTTAGNYANSGTTTVEDAGTVMTIGGASTYTQTTGGTLLNGGGQIVASAMNLSGGFIRLTNTSVPASQPLSLSGSASFEGVGSSSWAGTITVSNSVFDISSGTTTLTGQITGTGGITKLGAGTLELADTPPAANNFTGQVVVNAGSLVLNRATPNTSIPETAGTNGALPLGSRAIEINGGTLVLAQAAQIGDTRTMLLNGGTFDTGGFNETLGALTLQSNSVIDFGSGASLLSFANSSSQAWNVGSTLAIWNWSGTPVTGGGADQLLFGPGGLTVTQASQIAFYSGAGGGFIGMGTLVGSEVVPNGIVPVPEPSAALSAMGLIMLIGWRERSIFLRRRQPRNPDSANRPLLS